MQREYSVNDSTYGHFMFKGINVLEHNVDEEFNNIYHTLAYSVWANIPGDTGRLFSNDFVAKSVDYFSTRTDNGQAVSDGDKYIENLTIIPNRFKDAGNVKASFISWLKILELLKNIEDRSGSKIHKGTAFYFAAGDAIESNDFESGMIMMHLALNEDIANNPDWESTPAHAFMTVNPENVGQYHKPLVDEMSNLIKRRLTEDQKSYKNSRNGNLVYDDFRSKFLNNTNKVQTSARYYFVYSLLRFWHMRKIHKARVTDDVIAPLVFGNLVGSLTLVVETLLRGIVPAPTRPSMATILQSLNMGIDIGSLQAETEANGFDATINSLISDDSIESDFKIAYLCRNQAFHVLENENVYNQHYIEITQSIFNCIFYTVENHH